jgi:hypothetical protein
MLSQRQEQPKSFLKVLFYILIVTAIISMVVATYFACIAYTISQENLEIEPIVNNQPIFDMTNKDEPKTVTAQTKFDILGVVFPKYSVEVTCIINSSFVQNSPSTIFVSLSFPVNCWHDLDIGYIEVQPINALVGSLNWQTNTYDPHGFSALYLYQVDNIGASQVWEGSDGLGFPVLFQDSGLIKLQLEIYASPSQSTWEKYNGTSVSMDDPVFSRLWNFNTTFITIITLPIYIESSQTVQIRQAQEMWQSAMLNQTNQIQSIENRSLILQHQIQNQQESSGNMNFALTFFIITLTCIDLAFVVQTYINRQAKNDNDHSNQTSEYEEEEIDY